MSNIDTLIELESQGKLKPLVKAGLFPSKVYVQMNVYLLVKSKTPKVGKQKAAEEASSLFSISVRHVHRICKNLMTF